MGCEAHVGEPGACRARSRQLREAVQGCGARLRAQLSRMDAQVLRDAVRGPSAFSDLPGSRSGTLGPTQGGARYAAAQPSKADCLAWRQARLSRPEANAISRVAERSRRGNRVPARL